MNPVETCAVIYWHGALEAGVAMALNARAVIAGRLLLAVPAPLAVSSDDWPDDWVYAHVWIDDADDYGAQLARRLERMVKKVGG